MAEDCLVIDGIRFLEDRGDTFDFKFKGSDMFSELTDDFSFKSEKMGMTPEPVFEPAMGVGESLEMGFVMETFDDFM